MTRNKIFILPMALLLLGASSCSLKKPSAADDREKWRLSLNDSVAAYKAQIDSAQTKLSALQSEIGSMVGSFDHVSNPREVEGYYIYSGWRSRYPLSSTGIVARISEGEGLELIAALAGGKHFNQIEVAADGGSVASKIVPHDQALNYRTASLNTVCFSGSAADSVAQFIAAHIDSAVSLSFLDGKKTAGINIDEGQKKMIAATWNLYSRQREVHLLEKQIPMLSRKIDVCRRMMENPETSQTPETSQRP